MLFLDIDGVLHPGLAGTLCYAERFESFLRTYPEVQVVFSTSWRVDYSWRELAGYFSEDVRVQFIGATPELPDGTNSIREMEILSWLRRFGSSGAIWAALDDDASLFSPGCNRLVKCQTIRALRMEHLVRVRELLRL